MDHEDQGTAGKPVCVFISNSQSELEAATTHERKWTEKVIRGLLTERNEHVKRVCMNELLQRMDPTTKGGGR